jgi:hypothetical protein
MLSIRRGTVDVVRERTDGLVRLEVEGRPCIAYPRLTGPIAIGDDVLVNVQARELRLGSGGFDIVYANLTRGLDRRPDPGAHVMKLPYTPLQHAIRHGEEDGGDGAVPLRGTPVVCCSVHSQVVPVCAGLGTDLAVVYVQLPGGALSVSFSDAVRLLRQRAFLRASVAPGPALDGDTATVSLPAALAWCAGQEADAVVCALGPGIAGTGTRFGHGGIATAEAANVVLALGGAPLLAARASGADRRERHRGLSHHTRAALDLVLGPVRIAWPAGLEAPSDVAGVELVEVGDWREACNGLPLSHMGRGPAEDPWFFAAAFAAGRLARRMASERATQSRRMADVS